MAIDPRDVYLGGGATSPYDVLLGASGPTSQSFTAVVASSTESYDAATLAERIAVAAGSSSEGYSASALAERLVAVAGSSSEDYSAATLAGRISAAIATRGESYSAGTLAERLAAAIATSSEDSSAVTLVERLAAIIASSGESYSAATDVERVAFSVSSSSQASSAAVVGVPSGTSNLLVMSGGKYIARRYRAFTRAERRELRDMFRRTPPKEPSEPVVAPAPAPKAVPRPTPVAMERTPAMQQRSADYDAFIADLLASRGYEPPSQTFEAPTPWRAPEMAAARVPAAEPIPEPHWLTDEMVVALIYTLAED